MPASADTNLLFGILALQMDFISRDQLIAGMQAWALAKDTPLAAQLVQQGALRPAHRDLLEPLVAAHIREHGNDPQQSLAAISSARSLSVHLEAIADAEIQGSMGHLGHGKSALDAGSAATLPFVPQKQSQAGVRFRILRPHAEGGLGRVFVACDEELGREVALKEMKPDLVSDPDSRARFTREASITGGLEHPGIVPVYGLGAYADGRPFYAMRFVRGKSLKEAIEKYHRGRAVANSRSTAAEQNLQLRRLLQRLIDVCEAIHYAHSRGVLHRDLKPGNIMLGRYGETLVVDWGLAKALGIGTSKTAEDAGATPRHEWSAAGIQAETPLVPSSAEGSEPTIQGAAIGTPAYMSPEQASGRFDLLGPASDVFSLGATLYAILTGSPPYHGADALARAREADYSSPRKGDRSIAPALEAICRKAMAKSPGDRYSSADALARDLEKYLADEAVSAQPDGLADGLARFGRRHRAYLRAGVLALLLITAVAVISALRERQVNTTLMFLTKEKADLASANERLADDERRARLDTERQLRVATALRFIRDSKEVREDYPIRSLLLAMEGVRATVAHGNVPLIDAQNELRRAILSAPGYPLLDTENITAFKLSPDGKVLASGGTDGAIKLWHVSTGRIPTLHSTLTGHSGPAAPMGYSRNGQWLASIGEDKALRIWNVTSPDPVANCEALRLEEFFTGSPSINRAEGLSASLIEVVLSSDGRWVFAYSSLDGRGWSAYDRVQRRTFQLGVEAVETDALVLTPDEQHVIVVAGGKVYRKSMAGVLSGAEGQELFSVKQDPASASGIIEIQATSEWVVVKERLIDPPQFEARFTVIDLATGKTRVLPDRDLLSSCTITPSGRWLVMSGNQARAIRLPIGDENEPTILSLEGKLVATSVDGRWAYVSAADDVYLRWDLEVEFPKPAKQYAQRVPKPLEGTITSDGERIVGVLDQTLRVLNLTKPNTGLDIRSFRDARGKARGRTGGMRLSPSGRWLISAYAGETEPRERAETTIWDLAKADGPDAKPNAVIQCEGPLRHMLIGPGETWLALCGDDGVARVVSLQPNHVGAELQVLRGHEDAVVQMVATPDGKLLLTAGEDATVRVWDVSSENSESVAVLRSEEPVVRLAISQNGRWLAGGTKNGTLLLWDLQDVTAVAPAKSVKLHQGAIVNLAVAPNGRWVASGGRTLYDQSGEVDNTVRLWNVEGGAANSLIVLGKSGRGSHLTDGPIMTADGKWLIAEESGRIHVWRTDFEAAQNPLPFAPKILKLDDQAFGIALSGNRLLRTSLDAVYAWDLMADDLLDSQLVLPADWRTPQFGAASMSADGRTVAVAGMGGSTQVWNLRDEDLMKAALAAAGREFTPDERERYRAPAK